MEIYNKDIIVMSSTIYYDRKRWQSNDKSRTLMVVTHSCQQMTVKEEGMTCRDNDVGSRISQDRLQPHNVSFTHSTSYGYLSRCQSSFSRYRKQRNATSTLCIIFRTCLSF